MSIFEQLDLNPFQRLDEGLPLPGELALGVIARLWVTSNDKSKNYDYIQQDKIESAFRLRVKVMREAFKSGNLKGVDVVQLEFNKIAADENRGAIGLIPYEDSNRLRVMRECNSDIIIKKSDFIAWLESENTPLPVACQLEKWLIEGLSNNADKLQIKSKSLDDEYKDKIDVQKIGLRLKEEYKRDGVGFDCRMAKKEPDLTPYFEKYKKSKGCRFKGVNPEYSNKEGLKVDTWLWEIDIPPGRPGKVES